MILILSGEIVLSVRSNDLEAMTAEGGKVGQSSRDPSEITSLIKEAILQGD